jgi:L-ribulose-5-phosphate 4-epimerase
MTRLAAGMCTRRGWRLWRVSGWARVILRGAAAALDPMAVPACLVAGHAPFAWGKDVHDAAHNAVVLEAVARMAYRTLTLKAEADVVTQALLDRHYFRKHGAGATYGQK